MQIIIRLAKKLLRDQRGAAGPEFAAVVVPFFMVVFMIMGLSYAGWQMLIAAAGAPEAARARGVGSGDLGVITALPAAEAGMSYPPNACARLLEARLDKTNALEMPLLPVLAVPLRGGSYTRHWQFWGGPEGGCD